MPVGTPNSEVLSSIFYKDVSKSGESHTICRCWSRTAFRQFWKVDMWFEWLSGRIEPCGEEKAWAVLPPLKIIALMEEMFQRHMLGKE